MNEVDFKTRFGKRIKELRTQKGFTQEELAEMMSEQKFTISASEVPEAHLYSILHLKCHVRTCESNKTGT